MMKRVIATWKSWPRRRRRWVAGSVACLFLYTIVGFLILPLVVRSVVTKRLAKELDRRVTIRSVRFNPYTFTCAIRGFLIQDKDGEPFVAWGEVVANFQLASFFGRPWVFKSFSATNIFVRAQMNRDYTFNFSDLLEKFANRDRPTKPSKPLELRIDQLRLAGARAAFIDLTTRTPFRRVVGPLEITLNNFHTDPASRNPYSFVGTTDAGESFAWSGQFSLAPLRSWGQVTVRGIKLAKYSPLFEELVRFEVKDGVVGADLSYQLTASDSKLVAAVTNTGFRLSSFKIAAKDKPDSVVEVDELAMHGLSADTARHTVEIAGIDLDGARLDVVRSKDETVNLLELAAPSPAAANAPGGLLMLMRGITNAFAAIIQSTNLWEATVHQIDVTNCSVRFEDLVNTRPVQVRVDDLWLAARHLSNQPGSNQTAVLSLKWNTNGAVRVESTVQIAPPAAEILVSVQDLELRGLDPYLERYLNLLILGSKVGLEGRLNLHLGSNSLPDARFEGKARLDDFATVDGLLNEELVKCKSVEISDLHADLQPPTVAIQRIDIVEPFALLAVETNQVLNVLSALKTGATNPAAGEQAPRGREPAPRKSEGMGKRLGSLLQRLLASATNAEGGLPTLSVDTIAVSNAGVQFEDRSVQPPVKVSLHEFGGTIRGISSDQLKRAEIDLTGKAERGGPVEVKGRINPLNQGAPTELQVALREVDLTPISPYAGKFLGYRLNRGRLDLQVYYEVTKRYMKATNVVVLNQFTLGEKVNSPDATTLPVRLALALLKDRNGRIELDVPIEGNLDDPQFHYGKVVTHVLANLITKLVTSPFSALGALLGGKGEEVSYQDFAMGSAELQAAGLDKLNALIHGLEERPGLELEIEGCYEPAADREGLKKKKLLKDVRRKKWAAMRPAEQANSSPDQVPLAPDEYQAYVRAAYTVLSSQSAPETAAPARPQSSSRTVAKGAAALVKQPEPETGVSSASMERAVLDRILVEDAELKQLAAARAERVRQQIVQRIDPARIFLTDEPSTNQAARVFFHLR